MDLFIIQIPGSHSKLTSASFPKMKLEAGRTANYVTAQVRDIWTPGVQQ